MNPILTFSFVSGAFFALAATGLVINADPAIAQQADEEVIEEIVVTAPPVRRQFKRRRGGGWDEVVELRRRVSFADLDLSKHQDITELETRIETTAREACEKLQEMFPLSIPPGRAGVRRCRKTAERSAEDQLQAAIAAAAPVS